MSKPKDAGPQIGRLAMRIEGANWVAYYAHQDSMKGSIFLGAISMNVILQRPERKQQFMDLMREVVGDAIEATAGVRPVWGDPKTAPEHERSTEA